MRFYGNFLVRLIVRMVRLFICRLQYMLIGEVSNDICPPVGTTDFYNIHRYSKCKNFCKF